MYVYLLLTFSFWIRENPKIKFNFSPWKKINSKKSLKVQYTIYAHDDISDHKCAYLS